MQDARLLLLSLDRTSRYFQDHDTAARGAFLAANAAQIAKLTPKTLEGMLVKTALRAESKDPAAVATHRAAIKQYMAAFSAEAFVSKAEAEGFTFELYPRYRAAGWQFSWQRGDGRYTAKDRLFTSIMQGPAREEIRAAVLRYLIARAEKNGTLPDRHAFDAETYVREIETAGGGFQLKPADTGMGWEFWFSLPEHGAGNLMQMYLIHRAKNRRAITALLIRRAKAAGQWDRLVAWQRDTQTPAQAA